MGSVVGRDRHALEQLDRHRAVVESDYDQRHAREQLLRLVHAAGADRGRACRNRAPVCQSASSLERPVGPQRFPGLGEQVEQCLVLGPDLVARGAAAARWRAPGCGRRCRSLTTRSPRRTTDMSVNEQFAGSSARVHPHPAGLAGLEHRAVDGGIAGGGGREPGAVEVGGRERPLGRASSRPASAQARTSSPTSGATTCTSAPGVEQRLDLAGRDAAGARPPRTAGRRPRGSPGSRRAPARPVARRRRSRRRRRVARPSDVAALLVEGQDLQLDREVDLAQRHAGRARSRPSGAKLRIERDARRRPAGRRPPGRRAPAWR